MIKERLQNSLAPLELEVEDQSAQHIGHAGARGGGHFTVRIVSDRFSGKSRIERHRMVYQALGSAMQSEIHALSIKSLAPDEI
jgi:BolA protein